VGRARSTTSEKRETKKQINGKTEDNKYRQSTSAFFTSPFPYFSISPNLHKDHAGIGYIIENLPFGRAATRAHLRRQ
jgi:hypothetical protein